MLKNLLAVLLSLFICSEALAQETVVSEPKKLKQLYIGLGSGFGFTSAKYLNNADYVASANLTAAFHNNLVARISYLTVDFPDKLHGIPNGEELKYKGPNHLLSTLILSIGKKKTISKNFQVQTFASLSYTNYKEPSNITILPFSNYSNGQHISGNLVVFQTAVHHKPGIILQAEAMFLPLHFAGITLGGFYHFVPEISNGGITLSLNLGRIRLKEPEIL